MIKLIIKKQTISDLFKYIYIIYWEIYELSIELNIIVVNGN